MIHTFNRDNFKDLNSPFSRKPSGEWLTESDDLPYVRHLSEEDWKNFDPTGRVRLHLNTLVSESLTNSQPSKLFDNHTSIVEEFTSYQQSCVDKADKHLDYYKWNMHFIPKIGLQGGHYPYSELLSNLKKYYVGSSNSRDFDLVLKGQEYLIQIIKQQTQIFGRPQAVTREIYRMDISSNDTAASAPMGGKKGNFLALNDYSWSWDGQLYASWGILAHLLPASPGERIRYAKHRVIFMDPYQNVAYGGSILHPAISWLHDHLPWLFLGDKNPNAGLRQNFTKCVLRKFTPIKTDYNAMDQHLDWCTASTVVLPIFRELLCESDYYQLHAYARECYEQPLFVGKDGLWCGPHATFSGTCITHDFEDLYTICLVLGILLTLGVNFGQDKTRKVEAWFVVCGDDMTLLIDSKKYNPKLVMDMLIAEATMNGMEMSIEKCEVGGANEFCKKIYYESAPRMTDIETGDEIIIGASPSSLALCSILYPENYPATLGQEMVRILQILDGLTGSPDYPWFLDFIWNKCKAFKEWQFCTADIDKVQAKDWWAKLYGERWSPLSSESFKRIAKLRTNSTQSAAPMYVK